MAQDTSLRGAKVAQGGQNISRGAASPLPPTYRAYVGLGSWVPASRADESSY